MSIESSGEFQSIVLSSIMKDAYLYTRTSRYITNEFFTKYNYRVIYNAIKYYYDKYANLPTKNEALSVISEINNSEVVPTSEVKSEFITLYDTPKYNEDFVIDKITTFIKRNNVENVLKTYLPKISKGESIAVDTIGSDLAKGLSFTLSKANSFRLSDTEEIGEVRKNAIGTEDNPLVIPSFLSGINKSLQFHGYKPGDLIMICSPPGCLTGDTKIKLLDGTIRTIEDLYNNKVSPEIYGYNSDTHKIDVGASDYVKLTRYANDLVKVTIDDKYDIKCTPDHLFLLRSGEYKRADELKPNESLMPLYTEYRSHPNSGSKLISKDDPRSYEYVVNTDGSRTPTHFIVSSHLKYDDTSTGNLVRHHKDFNKHNNSFENLEWIPRHEHSSLHSKLQCKTNTGFLSHMIKKGEHKSRSTEFTSEQISLLNKTRWNNEEYRLKMHNILSNSSKSSKLVTKLVYDKDEQKRFRQNKVLKSLNTLIHSLTSEDTLVPSTYTKLRYKYYHKGIPTLLGIAKTFDCIKDDNSISRRSSKLIDYDKLSSYWDTLIDRATHYNHRVTKVERIHLDESVPVYDLVNSSVSNNYAVALGDDSGIFVHNCGKTMFMVNEGANASVLGFTVLHLFIGDMKEYDGFIRYTSRITEIPQDDIVAMPVSDQRKLVDKYNLQGYFNNIVVSSYAAGEISIDEMIQEVNRLQNEYQMHFDMILVDYADNLIPDSDMMYESGGNIYNKLSLLGYRNKSVIIVGSQPKPAYWDTEIIPKSAAADSSRKQHVIDVMITMGRAGKGAIIGSIHLPKVRRGREGGIIRYKSSFERAYMEAISDQEYLNLKGELVDL